MSLNSEEARRLALLARLGLSPEEVESYAAQLDVIFHHVDQLKRVEVAGVEPTYQVLPRENVTRPDHVAPSLPVHALEAMAPRWEDRCFPVPRILEEEAEAS